MCEQITTAGPARQPNAAAPPSEWAWLLRPGVDLVGYLAINGVAYEVAEQQFDHDGYADRQWDLRKPDGTTYRLCRDRDADLTCDCADATYRRRACKHVRAVIAAYEHLDREQRLAAFLDDATDAYDPAPAGAAAVAPLAAA